MYDELTTNVVSTFHVTPVWQTRLTRGGHQTYTCHHHEDWMRFVVVLDVSAVDSFVDGGCIGTRGF